MVGMKTLRPGSTAPAGCHNTDVAVRTVIDRGPKGKKVVAFSLDWPGWSRGAKTDELALETLETYRDRYRPIASLAGMAKARKVNLKPGARLVRAGGGATHEVLVTEDGFVWGGKTWGSLSLIAREMTGTRWSGPRFFGIGIGRPDHA